MDRLGSWRDDPPLTRRSVWLPALVTLVCVVALPFVGHAEFRGVLAVIAVSAAVRSSMAQLASRLTRHMSPVEEAWRMGYGVGYDDGQVATAGERRRGVDRRQNPAGLHSVGDEEL